MCCCVKLFVSSSLSTPMNCTLFRACSARILCMHGMHCIMVYFNFSCGFIGIKLGCYLYRGPLILSSRSCSRCVQKSFLCCSHFFSFLSAPFPRVCVSVPKHTTAHVCTKKLVLTQICCLSLFFDDWLFRFLFQSLVSTYSNDKLLRGQFSFSGKDSNGEPW